MKFTYILVSNAYYFGSETLTFYGIAAARECDGKREILDVAFDLSTDFEKVNSLVKICNEQKLALTHLHDVWEDEAIA